MTSGLVRADFALLRLDPGWLEESDSASFKAFFPGLPNQSRNVNDLPYMYVYCNGLTNQNLAIQIEN